jgi:transcriptional regulator with XRE-family HTH domain
MTCIAQQITNAREMRQLTEKDLADRTGLSLEFIFDIEEGIVDPNASVLLVIARELNCSFMLGTVSI